MKVLHHRERLERIGAQVLFVVHDDPALIRRTMLRGIEPPFPVLVDLPRAAYARWGLGRASARTIWGDPRVWLRYGRAVLTGHRPTSFGADTLQLGGDFVVDASGTIVYTRPQETDDRPPVAVLLRELERAALRKS